MATLSEDNSETCITTLSQQKFNEAVVAKKVVWPMADGEHTWTSSYGERISPITGAREVHSGMDMAGPDKSTIHSIASGTVMAAGPTYYLGQWVIVRHNFDGKIFDSVYGHLTENSQMVKVGDKVTAGQPIALEGTTGLSTGPHLHLEIWENGFMGKDSKHVDPQPWLKAHNVTALDDTPVLKPLDCAYGELTSNTNVAWGNYTNGSIPDEKLSSMTFNKDVRLENVAANKLEELNKVFHAKFGENLPLVKGYEDLAEQSKNGSSAIAGKSFFGWGKSIEFKFEQATNAYIPLVSEPNYFTDPAYVWLLEHGKEYGWITPVENQEDGDSPNPGRWVYSEQAANTNSASARQTYIAVNSMTHKWNSEAEHAAVSELVSQSSNWDTAYNNNGEYGIGKLTEDEIKKYGSTLAEYSGSLNAQISVTLNYITDKYGTPTKALNHWKANGTY
ncbi:MAG: peptidoglycan DD-metalloendopeptidase family protein [Enterococcus sp.]|nr:peptidoglycan DD-metalloendopeptidase family protein [Enterococcus sp.]